MWRFHIFLNIIIAWVTSQVNAQNDNRIDWDIKLNVPGDAGSDYPTLNAIPRTHFSCAGREPGYYADQETNCQVFRICTAGAAYGFQSFLCPNGTLFNQEVFVCDWWMNVNCDKSQEIQNNYSGRFPNLLPGPQLIKDVRKMITHPMRNPISNGLIKDNFIVTQTYKPSSELLYPNGAFTSSNSNHFYIPTKEPFEPNLRNDISFSASTYSPLYKLYGENNQNIQFMSTQSADNGQKSQANAYRTNPQSSTQKKSYVPGTNYKQIHPYNFHHIQGNTYNNIQKPETEFESNKINPRHSLQTPNAKISKPINVEAQQNLVSTNIQPTIISKTIAFKSLIPGQNKDSPKSRITFKTWILKPRNGKLIIKPTYTNKKLLSSASETSPLMSNAYVYDRPNVELKSSTSNTNDYFNNKFSGKQVADPDNVSPTTFRPNVPNRLYIDPEISSTTVAPNRYEITTLKTVPNTYIPPTNTEILSRQYLSPITLQRIQTQQNDKLLVASSSQTPQYEIFNPRNNNSPSLTVTKHSKVNTNHNNITFTDVLTKEKIDITLNDVVRDSNKFVQPTATHQDFTHSQKITRLLDTHKLKLNDEILSKERFTPKDLVSSEKSSKIIAVPSIHLEPPLKISNKITNNKLSNLPYYSEPVNTIERTVSIKITIPEKISKILFKNDSFSDDFEVLNTGSSNYLVYANNLAAKTGLTPIGKLSLGKYSNISNSQDLVFSFLADSLNAAKDYSNIAKQHVTPTPQARNEKYNNFEDITDKVSQLTSSQFTNNNVNRYNNKQQHIFQQNPAVTPIYKKPQDKYYQQRQTPPLQLSQYEYRPINSRLQNIHGKNQNQQLYSGQLYQHPVPEVTRDYYNLPYVRNNQYALPKINGHRNLQNQISIRQQNIPDIEVVPSRQLDFHGVLDKNEEPLQEQLTPAQLNSFLPSANGITAQVQDRITGTLSHPVDNDKVLTYNKDQSYYVFSQLNNNLESNRINQNTNEELQIQKNTNEQDTLDVQFIPSVGYKLNDENDKERLLNTFQINKFGTPSRLTHSNQEDLSTNVDYAVRHPSNYGNKFSNSGTLNITSTFISQQNQAINRNSKIEDLEGTEPNGYAKISPQPNFNT